ncbi:hypothetical protein GOV09_00090 [Candidatus Woesearchaeota archaeon]|nr:hypothetical protein [Candidatus Woesearchaeota archaeon]
MKIEQLWFNIYHGGVSPASEDYGLFVDNIVLSKSYVGCNDFPNYNP